LKGTYYGLYCNPMSKGKKLTGIFKRDGAANYTCTVKRFNRLSGDYKWVNMPTHTSDPAKALKTRAELQAVEDAAAAGGDSDLTRARAHAAVNSILKFHGVPEIQDERKLATLGEYLVTFSADLARTTVEKQRMIYLTHLGRVIDSLGAKNQIRTVDKKTIQDAFDKLPEMSPGTLSKHKMITVRFFEAARNDGLIDANPAKLVRIAKIKREKKQPFTVEEIGKLLGACDDFEHGDEWRLVCLFGLCLGARLHDACTRSWDEIDLETRMICYVPSKTKERGTKVLAPLVNPLLHRLSNAGPGAGRITPTLASWPIDKISLHFTRLMQAAGIDLTPIKRAGDGRDWTPKGFHSFRHTLPTMLAAAGVPIEIRMAIVGHTNESIHLGYTHKDQDAMRLGLDSAMRAITVQESSL
jgi:integrase